MRTETEIINSMGSLPEGITPNPLGEMSLWRSIAVRIIQHFELVLDLFKTNLEQKMREIRFGSFFWYKKSIADYQFADELIIDNYGVIKYTTTNPDKQIIKQSSINQPVGEPVIIKVATILNELLAPLNADQLADFKNYMNFTKPLGIDLNIVSLPADVIKITANVIIGNETTFVNVQNAIVQNLSTLRDTFDFDGTIAVSHFYALFSSIYGVRFVDIQTLESKPYFGAEFTADNIISLASGYFNYDTINIGILNSVGDTLSTITQI